MGGREIGGGREIEKSLAETDVHVGATPHLNSREKQSSGGSLPDSNSVGMCPMAKTLQSTVPDNGLFRIIFHSNIAYHWV